MSIELWAARLERPLTAGEEAALLALLPPARRERLARLRQPEKRRALWERYGWRDLPEIAVAAGGKPFFPDCPEVHFNLSHTAGAVLAALADRPVGADIERIRPVGRRLMERLTPGAAEEDFFWDWVRREALAKRGGSGVGARLSGEAALRPGERFYRLDTFPGYAAGVAVLGGGPPSPLGYRALEELL